MAALSVVWLLWSSRSSWRFSVWLTDSIGFDQLLDWCEQVLGRMRGAVAIGRPRQPNPAVGRVGVEFAGEVALVDDDQQPLAGQRRA